MSKKKKTTFAVLDPFYQRESGKYAEPIPSREFIMQILHDYGRPMSKHRLLDALGITTDDQEESLGYRFRAMLRDGQLMQDRRGRFCLLKHVNLQRGTIQAHPDGYGFLIPDSGGDDILLSAREMREVMHGDTVLVYTTGFDRRGRAEGKIHEVLEHANSTVVGRFFEGHGLFFVVPDSKRLTQEISIPLEHIDGAKHGQIVLVELISFPSKKIQAIGKVIQVIGDHMAPGMEIEVAILEHGIPSQWPPEVIATMANIPKQVSEEETKGRADLRQLPFVTIDGEDAMDFDDAVFCRPTARGSYQLFVAIADVSYYVDAGSPFDIEATKRGNSVYFPGRVVPMLPEALSNGICSLNPHVDRLCMVAEMSISQEGNITRSRFYRAVIHSHARLTYTQVGEWIDKGEIEGEYADLWPQINILNELFITLQKTRKSRGAMDFDSVETKIEFDENRKIQRIVPLVRNDAHRLIEECMLAANVAVAKFLEKGKIPTLYRVHLPPEEEKVIALRQFLGEFGIELSGGKIPAPKDFQKVLAQVEGRPDAHLIETVMLRSLKQAQYLEANSGHFGLAYSAYTHFTSPIRRYPDLLIHRAVGHLIDNEQADSFTYSDDEMSRLGKHCSITERRADDATRQVVSWLKCEYMQDKIGQEFSGRISAVTSFGIFVELSEIYVEGLVHITSLKNDYYRFDAIKHRLVGERSGMVYSLGDTMQVLVAQVLLDDRKIDFEPVMDDE